MIPFPVHPLLEVADILRAHGEAYTARHPVSALQAAVMRRLVAWYQNRTFTLRRMRLSLKAILVVLQWGEFHSCSPRPLGSRTRTAEYQYFGYQNPTFSLRTCARSNREHLSGCSRLLVNKIFPKTQWSARVPDPLRGWLHTS